MNLSLHNIYIFLKNKGKKIKSFLRPNKNYIILISFLHLLYIIIPFFAIKLEEKPFPSRNRSLLKLLNMLVVYYRLIKNHLYAYNNKIYNNCKNLFVLYTHEQLFFLLLNEHILKKHGIIL